MTFDRLEEVKPDEGSAGSTAGLERRRHPRLTLVRPCKVRDCRTLVFSPGLTSDVSVSGALLRIDRTRPIAPGDELEVAVAWTRDAVLSAQSMVRAKVRRVTPIDHHHQSVAVEFEPRVASAAQVLQAAA